MSGNGLMAAPEIPVCVGTPANPFRLIVGLGNPGGKYESTRHNIGFMILDELARRTGADFCPEPEWQVDLARTGSLRLCKPLSFMNLSGEPVSRLIHFLKIPAEAMLVVYDDAALPLGKLRLRPSGSSGGHNGMQSIIERAGTSSIPRLRIGIGAAPGEMTGHVLGKFMPEEMPRVRESIVLAAEAIEFAQLHGLEAAMNQFNQPTHTPTPKP
jgi:PTH1 family peptidyl-tRNA hydrolase